MLTTDMPKVTLVVVPRERFSCTARSLESIFEHTKVPFKLIYVDGNSPTPIREYLEKKAHERQFELIRTDNYLHPNAARNIGLYRVQTEYLVFIDNDVVVSDGWLDAMVSCADKTGADVVGPLVCQNEPIHTEIHCTGGEARIIIDKFGKRRLREKLYNQGKKVIDLISRLQRIQTEIAEFHCVLIRKTIFERIGYLDEALLNTREHVDFCLLVTEAGGSIYFEPSSIVTYVPGPPLKLSDIPFYMLRWSDDWELKSLHHIYRKWDVVEDGYFKTRYRRRGWRRYVTLFHPLSKKLLFNWNWGSHFLARVLGKLDHLFLNPYLTAVYARRQRSAPKTIVSAGSSESMI
ncbi:hypothetical protein XM38_034600 [Halomicronema hongdechloris C2206]|uniref:Glycosyltransferase 2-like domain-containing protein n=1 Tax=Halomicronema hongdechloris C2206 TaxID=1641165 RepID=A0A1Z3HQG2_9CYAN|nr:glycosyltransferase [Halomicronema hongdechloris]ASC72502.1 hypothetical protein XM38_034600 [Halomicronema hongdechloris C2206]